MPGPVGVQVFGGYAIRPGVFPQIDASSMVPNRPGPGGTVGYVSSADGGIPGQVYTFRSYREALPVVRGGAALSYLARMFAPSGDRPGASLVRWTRLGAPTQSTVTADGMVFTSIDYGRHTQGISVTIAAGVSAPRVVTIKKRLDNYSRSYNVGLGLSVLSTATTPKVVFDHAGRQVKQYESGSIVATLDYGAGDAVTLSNVAAFLSARAGWQAKVTGDPAMPVRYMDNPILASAPTIQTTYTALPANQGGLIYALGKGDIQVTAVESATGTYGVLGTALLDPSAAPTLATAATGGTIVPGTYKVQVSYTSASGETLASPEATIVVPAGTSTNTITVTGGALGTDFTGVKVYITPAGGATGTETLQGTYTTGTSLVVTAIVVGTALPTVNATGVQETYLAGGTGTANDTFTGTDWSNALALLENQDVHLLFLATSDPTAQALGYLHCINLRSVIRKRWRIFLTGGPVGQTVAQAIAAVPGFDGPCVYVWNGTAYPNPITGLAEQLGGLGSAAQVCGLAAGNYAKEPLTNKSVIASALEVAAPQDSDIDNLLTAGVTPIAPDPVTGQSTIVQAITTFQGGANTSFRLFQGLRIQDELYRLTQQVLSKFVGYPLDYQTGQLIKSDMATGLDQQVSSPENPAGYLTIGVINGQEVPAWTDLEVEGDGLNLWDVRVTVHPVGETDYIRVSIKLQPVKISL